MAHPKGLTEGLSVSAVGMVTPVGGDTSQSYTSVRAGLRRMRELPGVYLCQPDDPRFEEREPVVGSAVYHLDDEARERGRAAEWLARLAAESFRDLVRRARLTRAELSRTGLFLALPAPLLAPEAQEEVVACFHNFAEQDLLPRVQLAFGGRTAALMLAEQAEGLVRSGQIARAAVGAVDSYLFPTRLAKLDDEWRLLTGRNPDGFQPGEAAAFFLLEPANEARRRGAAPRATLHSCPARGAEPQRGALVEGAALSRLLSPLVDGCASAPLVVCDLNGESARMREWGFALARFGRRGEGSLALEHPASVLGDVGTASGAVLVALAVEHLGAKHADRSCAVVWAGSDDGERRAALLSRI